MTQTSKPSKQQVREFMAAPARKESPPLAPEVVRRQLGWHMIPENGAVPEVPE